MSEQALTPGENTHLELPWGELDQQPATGEGLHPRATLSLKTAGDFSLGNLRHREDYLERLGVDRGRVHFLNQVHSRNVHAVGPGEAGPFVIGLADLPNADGLVTRDRNAVLCITIADCLPVFLCDVRSGAFGLLHSGWKGTGIVIEALRIMRRDYDCRGEDMQALLGPCIGPCCYRVPEDRHRLFAERYGPAAALQREDGFYIDLQEANRALLAARGIQRVSVVSECTSCSPRLSSYRRDGQRAYGLMLAVAGYY